MTNNKRTSRNMLEICRDSLYKLLRILLGFLLLLYKASIILDIAFFNMEKVCKFINIKLFHNNNNSMNVIFDHKV